MSAAASPTVPSVTAMNPLGSFNRNTPVHRAAKGAGKQIVRMGGTGVSDQKAECHPPALPAHRPPVNSIPQTPHQNPCGASARARWGMRKAR